MKTERGEMRLERRPRAEDGQTGRTERDWSMDGDRRDNILDSDQLAQTFFLFFIFCNIFFSNHLVIRYSIAKTKMCLVGNLKTAQSISFPIRSVYFDESSCCSKGATSS